MKKFFLGCLLLLSLNSLADYSDYNRIKGHFGIDPYTDEPSPDLDSKESAIKIYQALNAQKKNDRKFLGVVVNQENMGLSCIEPRKNETTVIAMCYFNAILRAQDSDLDIRYNTFIRFGGAIAQKVFIGLNTKTVKRAGKLTKSVGNLSCSKPIDDDKSVKARCMINGLETEGISLQELIDEEEISQKSADQILKKLRI